MGLRQAQSSTSEMTVAPRAFQKLRRPLAIEHRILRLDAEKEAVPRSEREARTR